ncbi:hypothetical protein [Clostridium kluyveri]|uniref:hypothetical protein n=1 Tax=Clostridium kluyveri TaxID=1534 RepID=UPI0022474C89|nr:hypothetical protein [Clostridium kluyveri]UZQ52397.1 hypothetical protein OP486_09645 [Clostridium kluyveri]
MIKDCTSFKIQNINDVVGFISDFKKYARSGSYKIDIAGISIEKVIIKNGETPSIERSTKLAQAKVVLSLDNDIFQHIIEMSRFYEVVYENIMQVHFDIKEAVVNLEKIIKPLGKEGYAIGGVISNVIERLNDKSTTIEESYQLMKEVDEFLLQRGFPFVCMSIYEDEIDSEFEYDISPYLDLGEFEDFGLETKLKTEEFIQDFIENNSQYMNCVWNEEGQEYFDYNIGTLALYADYCKLWIEDGFICRQKERNRYNYEWPIEKYSIDNKDDLSKLVRILEPDIRLINYAQAYRTQD